MSHNLALVTGASGFLGSAVARKLSERGFRVRALVRATSPLAKLKALDCEIVEGDLCDTAAIVGAMRDVRYLFHLAADYRLWARDPAAIMRTNYDGTRMIMLAARDAGLERIVYTSSVATLSPRVDGSEADERDRAHPRDAIGAYKKSKIAAERLLERMIEDGLPAVIVSPSAPIGPGDLRPTPTGRVLVEAAAGRVPAYVDTGLNLVHVDDVAEGHVLALEKGCVGETYILGGQNVTLREMLGEIARLSGRQPPRIRLPRLPIYPIAYAAEALARVTAKEPFLTTDALAMSRRRMFFNSEKAMRELGFRARPYRAALQDAILWFQEVGYIPRPAASEDLATTARPSPGRLVRTRATKAS